MHTAHIISHLSIHFNLFISDFFCRVVLLLTWPRENWLLRRIREKYRNTYDQLKCTRLGYIMLSLFCTIASPRSMHFIRFGSKRLCRKATIAFYHLCAANWLEMPFAAYNCDQEMCFLLKKYRKMTWTLSFQSALFGQRTHIWLRRSCNCGISIQIQTSW